MKEIFRLFKLAAPFKYWMALAAVLGFITIGSGIGLLMTSAYIIAKAALHPSIADLQVGIVGVRFFGISRGVFRYLERLISHETTFRLLAKFREWFYSALEPLAPAGLSRRKRGDLLARFISDIQSLEGFYVRVIAPPFVSMLVLLFMYLLLGRFNHQIAFILLDFQLLAGILLPVMTYQLSRRNTEAIILLRSRLNNLLVDSIQGMPELLLFDQTREQQIEVESINQELTSLQKREKRIIALHESFVGLLMNGAVLSVLVYAIPLVNQGLLDGVMLSVFTLGVMASFEAFVPLPAMMEALKTSKKAAQRLFEITDTCSNITASAEKMISEEYSIKINHLSFQYPHTLSPALKDFELDIPFGTKVAVVGPSGSGKTTLINLLMRFWDSDTGCIYLGKKKLREIDREKLPDVFGVIRQNPYIFSGTIRDNLLIAKPQAGENELINVTKKVLLDNVLEKSPDGLDTWIGDQGQMLSGGERQKLALARVLLRDTPVLILDEINAHLDALGSQKIMRMLWNLAPQKTIVLITHFLSELKPADRIVVLREGRIIESGTHTELITGKGYYYKMLKAQNEKKVIASLPNINAV
ncbi:MAG TPA: thiol reductant ABC exporter subunit CydC [Calditrichaeota bacterium]|nr:thiol reductant ABC exporter subunit CydC [Calditrichota bacterium]